MKISFFEIIKKRQIEEGNETNSSDVSLMAAALSIGSAQEGGAGRGRSTPRMMLSNTQTQYGPGDFQNARA